jgi:hypothetical protein
MTTTTIISSQITAPQAMACDIGELERQLGIDMFADDDLPLAEAMIETATAIIEAATGVAMIERELRVTAYNWPAFRPGPLNIGGEYVGPLAVGLPALELPGQPVKLVDTITDGDGADISAQFVQLIDQRPARIAAKDLPQGTVIVDYTAGYGASASAVPRSLRLAVAMLAAHLYTHRGDECATPDAVSASGIAPLLRQYMAARL